MLTRWKEGARSKLSLLIDGAEVVGLVAGSAIALVFGKLLAAVLFAALAAGVTTRFFRRSAQAIAPAMPLWGVLISGGVAVVACAAAVEAINLPVRFDQVGFDKSNLLIVVALLLVFYGLVSALLRRMLRSGR